MKIIPLAVDFLLFYLQLCSSAQTSNNGSFKDEQALLAFKNSISSDPNKVLLFWDANTNVCNWTGISCNKLMRVSKIDLESRGLEGYISPFLGNLSFLKSLKLSDNHFHGVIPELGQKLSNLQELHLWGNQLSGPIPTSLGNCSKMEFLDLSLNNIRGTVPLQLGKLSSLQRLLLYDNFLTSSRTLPFLTALINCSSLQTLYLGYNHLAEDLSPSIGKLSTNLSVLSLQQNHLGGSIPQEIGNLTNLILINFTGNALTGPIPSTLEMLQSLERLYLGQNKLEGHIPSEIGALGKSLGLLSLSVNLLSGKIPETIGNLSQLRRLQLDNNQFGGRIPVNLGNCLILELVDLSHNYLTGNIPPDVAGLKNLQFYFNLSWNLLQGSLPIEVGKMVMVQGIDLSGNQLSGIIPNAISSCTSLEYLNLSHNMFEGPIPVTVSHLKNLEALDLSCNKLSGMITEHLQELTMLNFLNVSFNLLIGEIAKMGLFANLTASSFRGNPGLCGQWIASLPACPSAGSPGDKLFIYIITITLVVYCLYVLILYKYCFWKENVEPSIEFPHPRISYKELSTATNGFGKGNLLGAGSVGSVYKGVLANGTLIAVKALNLENEAAHKSFGIECQVLGKTRHRNIIKVITACSNLDFKDLVFEFMSNGNLEKQLHCDAGKCNIGGVCKMNLQTRLQIAMDVARGLAYLHHDCSIQVVHCDLKPNNVLLDFYMTAHIADFGNAHLLSENSVHSFSASTTLKGALGYIAPEYGVGARISAKGDVYSYGILLLEMLTRKRPTHQMFVDGLNLHTWVSMAFPDRISEVVDDSLLLCNGAVTDATCNCLIQLIRVALLCSKDPPKDRPSMAEVVELLECIEDMFEGSRMGSKYPSDLYQMVSSTRWAGNLVKVVEGQSTSTLQSTS